MEITNILGINAFCERGSMDKVICFFRDVLGAKITSDQPWLEEYGFRAKGAWLGDDMPFRIEIGESIDDALPMGKEHDTLAPTFQFLSLVVKNLDEAVVELQTRGIKVSDKVKLDDPRFGEMYECAIHPRESYGLIIELVEINGKSPKDGEW